MSAYQNQINLPSSGNNANYEEEKYQMVTATEVVEIPEDHEMLAQQKLSEEELNKEQQIQQSYYKQMNEL